jgi:hypothetical protein
MVVIDLDIANKVDFLVVVVAVVDVWEEKKDLLEPVSFLKIRRII